jgi:hypothetical protein
MFIIYTVRLLQATSTIFEHTTPTVKTTISLTEPALTYYSVLQQKAKLCSLYKRTYHLLSQL